MLKKEYKNWREICREFGWNTIGGSYRNARLKYFESLCSYHKEGNKFIIDEIYETPKPVEDARFGYKVERLKKYDSLSISENEYKDIGIYKIILDNKIYIGSTIMGFRDRFLFHYYGHDKTMKHTYELIKEGGKFEILENMNGEDEETIRKKEDEYIQKYKEDDSWILINNIGGWGSKANNRKKYTTIRIEVKNLEKAKEILKENGLI